MAASKFSISQLGIICAVSASLNFTITDACIKFLSGDYPLHQIILIRSVLAIMVTLALFVPLEGGYRILRTQKLRMHLMRGLFVVLANSFFFIGIASVPLSQATALFFVAPIIITLFSVIFLREKVGRFRWFATVLGLTGAVIMLRPNSDDFQVLALFPLLAAVCYAGLHTMSRKMGGTEKASTMSFYVNLSFIFVSIVMALGVGDGRFGNSDNVAVQFMFRAWVWPQSNDLWILGLIGLTSAMGGFLIGQAYRLCEAALIAPFEYVALVLAVMWGIVIFNEWPDLLGIFGIALILSSGLVVVWREAVLKRRHCATLLQQR